MQPERYFCGTADPKQGFTAASSNRKPSKIPGLHPWWPLPGTVLFAWTRFSLLAALFSWDKQQQQIASLPNWEVFLHEQNEERK